MRTIKCILAYLLIVSLAMTSFVSEARERRSRNRSAYSQYDEASLSSNGLSQTIYSFEGNGFPDGEREIWIPDGLTLDEVQSLLPEAIPAVFTDGEKADVPVSWTPDVDYDPSLNHFYMFTPVWDTELYGEGTVSGRKIPHIFVIVRKNSGSDDLDSTGATALENEEACFTYFTEVMKLSSAAACGIMANIRAESNFNTNALGDSGTSYGICQWHNSRWTKLNNFCEENGLDPSSLDGQLKYLRYELEGSYRRKVLDPIKSYANSAQGAYDSAYCFCVYFEVPANKETRGDTRGIYARDVYWLKYGGYAPETTMNVTLKQVRKANTFYNDAYALYDVESLAEIRSVKASYDGEAGFSVSSYNPESGLLTLSADRLSSESLSTFTKKVTLTFTFSDENVLPTERTITVGTYVKAPVSLKASQGLVYDGKTALVSLYDKATGRMMDVSGDNITVWPSKTGIGVKKSGDLLNLILERDEKKWSGKLNVLDSGWTKPVQVTVTVKRAVKPQKPVLDRATVNLYSSVPGDSETVRILSPSDLSDLTVTGVNERSKEALENGLIVIKPASGGDRILLSLSENAEDRLPRGTYAMSLRLKDYEKTSTLSVKVNKNPVSVSYKAAGAIDLTKRSSSLVTLTPTVKNPVGARVRKVSVESIEPLDSESGNRDLRSGFRFVESPVRGSFSLRYAYGSDDLHVGKYRMRISGHLDDPGNTEFKSEVLISVKQSLPAAKAEPSVLNVTSSVMESGMSVSVSGNSRKYQDLRVLRETVALSQRGDDDRLFIYENGRLKSTCELSTGASYKVKLSYRYYGQDQDTADRYAGVAIELR